MSTATASAPLGDRVRCPLGEEAETILLVDHTGHAFTFELARSLGEAGVDVVYSYCSTAGAPTADFSQGGSLTVCPVATRGSFEKYRLARRVWSELCYGMGSARVILRSRPTTLIVCNMPLISLLVLWLVASVRRCKTVVWLQDVQSGLARRSLGDRHIGVRGLGVLEGFLLARAHLVVAISDRLAREAVRLGANGDRVKVLENWAPVEQLPLRPRNNRWARAHGLTDRKVLLYSGTLARKHSPELLLMLADAVNATDATVVVVSEGEGSEWLRQQQLESARSNLLLLPFQPFGDLPDVLASADILVTLLDQEASDFSVPSKTLAYLCAGRPIVASMPSTNAAADLITKRAQAGSVVEPGDRARFVAETVRLMNDDADRARKGRAARAWAEANFREDAVASRFLDVIAARHRRPSQRL